MVDKSFWEFVEYIDLDKNLEKGDECLTNLINKKYDNLQIKTFYHIHGKLVDELRNRMDDFDPDDKIGFGGGDDYVYTDLLDIVISKGESFYNKMINNISLLSKFGKKTAHKMCYPERSFGFLSDVVWDMK